MRRDRYTVAFDEKALATMAVVASSTNYQDVPDFIRASVTVMADLLDVSGRKLSVIFRDDATGREWAYSPHEPGRAIPIPAADATPEFDNVFRPTFGQKVENQLQLGTKTIETDTGAAAASMTPPTPISRARRGR